MAAQPLPSAPSASRDFSDALNHRLRRFLDDHFTTATDLLKLPSLSVQLDRECRELEEDLRTLTEDKLFSASSRWLSRSHKACQILDQVDGFMPSPLPATARRMLEVDIPLLEKEVTRIDTIRLYAESSLQLESLVGDLEDTALAIVSQASSHDNILSSISGALTSTDLPWKQEKMLLAVKTMNFIENKLSNITNHNPQWIRLVMTVDSRVEKAISILKPQALTDHRAILASLGWPPSLLSSKLEKDNSLEGVNPLLHMQGDKKEKYSQSFLTLCSFQQLLVQRETRKSVLLEYLRGHKSVDSTESHRYSSHGSGLWTINELVHPIASRIEHHFEKWSDQPKFIFALVYKITQDFVDAVDHVLQPLVDKARFLGSSVREAWVAAMLTILLGYLEREVFPVLVRRYELTDKFLEVDALWLDLVDLIITFDKRMRMLAVSGMQHMESFIELERACGSLSLFSIFEEHSDWLHIWAEIELEDASDKLKPELENEKSWLISTHHQHIFSFEEETDSFLLSNREEFKASPITDCIIKTAWHMVERGVLLPTVKLQNQFMRSSVVIFLNNFFITLVQRSSSGGLAAAIMEDDALLRLAGAINTTRYLESVLREWSEDVRFMEMSYAEGDSKNEDQHLIGSLFKAEIMYLVKLETDFLEEIMSDTLLQFDALCWDYIDYIKQWGEMKLEHQDVVDEENPCVSLMFVGALEMLKDRLHILRSSLNSIDFLDLWRSIADGLDHYIFSSIAMSDAKLSYLGVNQFKHDMSALFLIFSAFCARPQSFFPCTHDYLKLLTFDQKDATFLLHVPEDDKKKEEFLRRRGLFHVSVNQAKKILRNRILKVESKAGI